DDLLRVFRVFKEIRNSISHSGGRATQQAVAAYAAASGVTAASTRMPRRPLPAAPVEGNQVRVTLEQIFDFAEVIARIVTTLDADEVSHIQISVSVIAPRRRPSAWPCALTHPVRPTARPRSIDVFLRPDADRREL